MKESDLLKKFKRARDNTFYEGTKKKMFKKRRLVHWHFNPLYVSFKGGLLILVCVFNRTIFSRDQSLVTIEFRKKYSFVQRTSLSVFGITLLEEEEFKKLKGDFNESRSS